MGKQARYSLPAGTGPGIQTPDGCSVELYRRLPYRGDLDGVASLLRGKNILELGCGAGRLTRKLLELGCHVTAIDNSREMLALLPDPARRALSDIETVELDQYFDVALLASFIFNQPDDQLRLRLAKAARRHLREGGSFALQVHSESLLDVVEGRTAEADGMTTRIAKFSRAENLVDMSVQYSADEMVWTHTFQALFLEFDRVVRELMNAGFSEVEWIDKPRGWLVAI